MMSAVLAGAQRASSLQLSTVDGAVPAVGCGQLGDGRIDPQQLAMGSAARINGRRPQSAPNLTTTALDKPVQQPATTDKSCHRLILCEH